MPQVIDASSLPSPGLDNLNPLTASNPGFALPEAPRPFRRANLEPYLEGWGSNFLYRPAQL